MYIDSHCHLSFPELKSQLPDLLAAMDAAQVTQAVCICTTMEEFPEVREIADAHAQLVDHPRGGRGHFHRHLVAGVNEDGGVGLFDDGGTGDGHPGDRADRAGDRLRLH